MKSADVATRLDEQEGDSSMAATLVAAHAPLRRTGIQVHQRVNVHSASRRGFGWRGCSQTAVRRACPRDSRFGGSSPGSEPSGGEVTLRPRRYPTCPTTFASNPSRIPRDPIRRRLFRIQRPSDIGCHLRAILGPKRPQLGHRRTAPVHPQIHHRPGDGIGYQ